MRTFFITGIGTNVGKTIASAVLTEALRADYWKPVQCGFEEGRDSDIVKALISNSVSQFHEEAYLFREPASPHLAAKLENAAIDIDSIRLPDTKNDLIIEGAGGIMVPLNDKEYVIDLARRFNCRVVLVVASYLGCINHSLLSIDYLLRSGLHLEGLILNGEFDPEVEKAICNYRPVKVIGRIAHAQELSKEFVKAQALNIKL